jgi:hypothetical protein
MIIRITLKDPNGIDDSIREAAKQSLVNVGELEHEEAQYLLEARQKRISESLKPWIEYGEYVRLEIDLETKAAKVITNE